MAWTNIENGESMASVRTKLNELGSSGGGAKYVDVAVVGGGGGGGAGSDYCRCCYETYAGGGGGGQVVQRFRYPLTKKSYSVQVGVGGAGGGTGASWSDYTYGKNGGNSVFDGIIAYGGGGGACNIGTTGNAGGYGQGRDCGHAGSTGSAGYNGQQYGGQGGGAYPNIPCSNQGAGVIVGIDFKNLGYGGGGNSGLDGAGGVGGEGTRGGGGGGARYNSYAKCNVYCCGSKGGDGVVIIRYRTDGSDGITSATGGTKTTCNSYTIHTFTSSGTFTIVS